MTLGSAPERRETPRLAMSALWFGMLGGIVAWAVGFTASYPLAGSCGPAASAAVWVVTLATLALTGAATLTAWRNWRAVRGTSETGSGGWPGRAAFMSFSGMLLSGGALLLTLAHALPLLVLEPCVVT